ncbi:MAG TPA: FixH family protein [Blastocatellia bacterium]|nr:FixH family protein [Blastocatellia bacterium]
MKRQYLNALLLLIIISALAIVAACTGAATGSSSSGNTTTGQVIVSQKAGDLTVTLSNARGHFTEGSNDFTIEFKNAAGQPVDVGAITMFIDMPAMGSMPYMKNDVKLVTTNTPGIYHATTSLEMAGTWQVHVRYKGQAGEGRADFSIHAR